MNTPTPEGTTNPALPGMPEMPEPVVFANPVILLPLEPGDSEEWAARVQSHKDGAFTLALFTEADLEAQRLACFAAGRADASKDAERLDWLIEHETHVREVNGAFTLFGVGRFSSGREAIDAAMQKFSAQEADHADQA